MERAVDLPIELRRLIYQRYLQARARHLWNAVRQFVKRLQTVYFWVQHTRYAELRRTAHWYRPMRAIMDRMTRLSVNLFILKKPPLLYFPTTVARFRVEYNIRPQRGVKRPLEDFL